jgi:hypothetical protein
VSFLHFCVDHRLRGGVAVCASHRWPSSHSSPHGPHPPSCHGLQVFLRVTCLIRAGATSNYSDNCHPLYIVSMTFSQVHIWSRTKIILTQKKEVCGIYSGHNQRSLWICNKKYNDTIVFIHYVSECDKWSADLCIKQKRAGNWYQSKNRF